MKNTHTMDESPEFKLIPELSTTLKIDKARYVLIFYTVNVIKLSGRIELTTRVTINNDPLLSTTVG